MVEVTTPHKRSLHPHLSLHTDFGDIPLQVHVNPEEMGRYMKDRGLRRKLIRTMKIDIHDTISKEELQKKKGISEGETVSGDYLASRNEMRLFAGAHIRQLQEIKTEIIPNVLDIAQTLHKGIGGELTHKMLGNYLHRQLEKAFVHPDRIQKYLMVASEERSRGTLERLALIRANRKLNGTFFHEAEHAKDLDVVSTRRAKRALKIVALPLIYGGVYLGSTVAESALGVDFKQVSGVLIDFFGNGIVAFAAATGVSKFIDKIFKKRRERRENNTEATAQKAGKPNKLNIAFSPFTISQERRSG